MANPHRGTVEVELDGEPHQLRYTLNSLAEIENRLDLASIQEILSLVQNLSMRTLRTLLWAGLIHARPELTEREVGEMDFDFTAVVKAVSEAVGAVFATAPPTNGKAHGGPEGNARRPRLARPVGGTGAAS